MALCAQRSHCPALAAARRPEEGVQLPLGSSAIAPVGGSRAHKSVSPGVWPCHPSGNEFGAARGPRLLPWGGPPGRRSAQGVADPMESERGPAWEPALGLSAPSQRAHACAPASASSVFGERCGACAKPTLPVTLGSSEAASPGSRPAIPCSERPLAALPLALLSREQLTGQPALSTLQKEASLGGPCASPRSWAHSLSHRGLRTGTLRPRGMPSPPISLPPPAPHPKRRKRSLVFQWAGSARGGAAGSVAALQTFGARLAPACGAGA